MIAFADHTGGDRAKKSFVANVALLKTRTQRPPHSIFRTLALNLLSERYWKILVTLSWRFRSTTHATTNRESSLMVQLKECSRDTLILN